MVAVFLPVLITCTKATGSLLVESSTLPLKKKTESGSTVP
jgi:hypothetical protein